MPPHVAPIEVERYELLNEYEDSKDEVARSALVLIRLTSENLCFVSHSIPRDQYSQDTRKAVHTVNTTYIADISKSLGQLKEGSIHVEQCQMKAKQELCQISPLLHALLEMHCPRNWVYVYHPSINQCIIAIQCITHADRFSPGLALRKMTDNALSNT